MNVNSVTDLWFKKSKIHAHCVSRKWTWTALSEMALLALERSKSLVEIRANSTPCHLETHSWTTSLKVRPLNMKPPEHCHLFLSMWRSHEAEAGNKAAQRLRPQIQHHPSEALRLEMRRLERLNKACDNGSRYK